MSEKNNFSYMNMIACKFSATNNHILKNPKILPCGFTACYDCIRSNLQINSQLNCPFEKCKQVHEIDDPSKLITNAIIENAIEENMNFLTKTLIKQLQEKFDDLSKIYTENRAQLSKEFESIESDIKRRCELLIAELRNIENNLLDTLRISKDKVLTGYEKKFETITSQACACNKDVFKFCKELSEANDVTQMRNIEALKEDLYKYQECLNNLDNLGLNLKENTCEIKFATSLWLPSLTNIGVLVTSSCINQNNDLNMSSILQVAANTNIVHLNCGVKKVSKLCNLSDKYLILLNNDDTRHELTILDENFSLKTRLSSIGSRKFKQPITLCSDDIENIYLCDYGYNQILILDFEFSVIKRIIGKKGKKTGEFNGLIDICYYANRLYVLDKNKRVQFFTKQGDFIREMKLFKNNSADSDDADLIEIVSSSNGDSHSLNSTSNSNESINEKYLEHPLSIKVCNNTLAILDNYTFIYIYNLDGYLKQIINSEKINAFSLTDNYLFILKEPSTFTCYEFDSKENVYFNAIRTVLSNTNDIYSDMCYFKGRWIFSSCLTGRLSVLLK